eukprot:PhF_6_TR25984/c0_g1_i1/m.36634/K06875/PDCD5, TFAR19; programmed cell death protein 5
MATNPSIAGIDPAQIQKQQQQEEKRQQQEEQMEGMLRAVLSAEARDRLKRIEVVKPERAREVEVMILNAVRAGRLTAPVSDETVKDMLTNNQGGGGGASSKITFVRKKMDDDW